MKNKLLKTFLTIFIAIGAFTTISNVKENNEDKIIFKTTDDTGRGEVSVGEKRVTIGDATVTAVSETKAQYGLDEDGNYRIRFVTALTGDVSKLTYTLSVDGDEYGTYSVTTVYESVLSGEDTLYYDGTNFVKEKPATINYYFACGSIEVGPKYYATEFSAQLTLTKSDTNTVESTARTTTVNELVNYQYTENYVADFETPNQLGGFIASDPTTSISLSNTIKYNGTTSMKFVPNVAWSKIIINGAGLGIDSLENCVNLKMKVYAEDNSTTNVYGDTTHYRIILNYDGTDVSVSYISKANEWVDAEFTLENFNLYNLSSNKFSFFVVKFVDGVNLETGAYENTAVYFDDIYVTREYFTANNIEEVKEELLSENPKYDISLMKEIISSTTSDNKNPHNRIKFGTSKEENDLNSGVINTGGTNGWSGFRVYEDVFQVIYADATTIDSHYYAFTAPFSGYVYISQVFSGWGVSIANLNASIDNEVIYESEWSSISGGTNYEDEIAVYLNANETIRIQFNKGSNEESVQITYSELNVNFVVSEELSLPDGYTSLIEYLNA